MWWHQGGWCTLKTYQYYRFNVFTTHLNGSFSKPKPTIASRYMLTILSNNTNVLWWWGAHHTLPPIHSHHFWWRILITIDGRESGCYKNMSPTMKSPRCLPPHHCHVSPSSALQSIRHNNLISAAHLSSHHSKYSDISMEQCRNEAPKEGCVSAN